VRARGNPDSVVPSSETPVPLPPGPLPGCAPFAVSVSFIEVFRSIIYLLHARGQNAIATVDVQFVCGVGANTGAFHFSY